LQLVIFLPAGPCAPTHLTRCVANEGKYFQNSGNADADAPDHSRVYAYLFAKKARANISAEELTDFRAVADLYAQKTESDIAKELQLEELVEICREIEA
jgi:hypothetical protein